MFDKNIGGIPGLPYCFEVLKEKYLKNNETSIDEVYLRVSRGIAQAETEELRETFSKLFYENMKNGAIGAGRIMSSGGTGIQATLINCFVQPVGDCISGFDEDGNPGIYVALEKAAETMRMGGGVGYNFSKVRPYGAWIKSTQSMASGPCSYMNVFDASCMTVESLGARRGAQLSLLEIDHPDIEEFIKAKHVKGRWNNFNVSVGVSEVFMKAVENDSLWVLKHSAKPHPNFIPENLQVQLPDGKWFYKEVKARDLWNMIMENTYDHAEPGIIFLDTVNRENPLYYIEKIETTNPCVTADTWVHTTDGPKQVEDLIGKPFSALVHGLPFKTISEGFFSTGTKEVFKLQTTEGYSVKLTAEHKVLVEALTPLAKPTTVWKEAKDLIPGDKIVLNDHNESDYWPGSGTDNQGYILGYLLGNGTIKDEKAVLPVWLNGKDNSYENNKGEFGVIWHLENAVKELNTRSDFKGFQKPVTRNGKESSEVRLATSAIRDLAESVGMTKGYKELTPQIEKTSSDFHKGFIRGLFDADGTVDVTDRYIRLSQSNQNTLYGVQRMLARLGIKSTVYLNRRPAGERLMPDGQGGQKLYYCEANHELNIRGLDLLKFFYLVDFRHADKQEKLLQIVKVLKPYSRSMTATFTSLVPVGFEAVYDVSVESVHAFDGNGLMLHNCGEQPLPPYGCCDLGPINLTQLVTNPFGFNGAPEFDFEKLKRLTTVQVRFLDNVLTVTHWPLEEQKNEAMNKRRIGIGFTGLGNTLAMLCLKYGSQEGRDMAAKIAETMRNASYAASIELAKEKGPFPLFDADKYLAGDFIKRLPAELHLAIREFGIRNSHLLSIAPTGTVSLAFCNNASSGIEPPFTWTYDRKKRQQDGSITINEISDYSYRLYKELGGDTDNLPDYMQTALGLSAIEHMQMMEAVQPFIDSAISKTVNVPEDYPYDDFKNLYTQAWKANLKGIATYRPNATLGSVLSVKEEPKKEKPKVSPVELSKEDVKSMLEKKVIHKRPKGALDATIEKVEYSNHLGRGRFYLSIGYLKLEDQGVQVLRPIEFFLKNLDAESNDQWSESAMRMLSLAARGGFLDRALTDMQKVRWDRGPVRLGETLHVDGHKVPKFHESESAAVAYAIISSIKNYKDRGASLEPSQAIPEVKDEEVAAVNTLTHGKACPECGAHAMVKRDGCSFCENCGAVGSCG